jgi:Zn-dependent peptidase ImmA (M78 family)
VPGLDPSVVKQLTIIDGDSWSAVTLRLTRGGLIIINETHIRGRQNNTIAHELSHIILKHEPTQVFFTPDGMMMLAHYNKTFEKEADCLASTLLVTRESLLFYLDEGRDDQWLAKYFGVTTKLIQMRRNMTGVDLQRRRRRA